MNKDRLVEVCPEKILILECLGPSDSDWNQQSFQVGRNGCVGGRKHNPEDAYNSREIVLFKDITVSRRHFEVRVVLTFPFLEFPESVCRLLNKPILLEKGKVSFYATLDQLVGLLLE